MVLKFANKVTVFLIKYLFLLTNTCIFATGIACFLNFKVIIKRFTFHLKPFLYV